MRTASSLLLRREERQACCAKGLLRCLQLWKHEACPFVQVFCNGEEVLTVSGTKEKYVVDVWSGNHPFYLVRSWRGVSSWSVCVL